MFTKKILLQEHQCLRCFTGEIVVIDIVIISRDKIKQTCAKTTEVSEISFSLVEFDRIKCTQGVRLAGILADIHI